MTPAYKVTKVIGTLYTPYGNEYLLLEYLGMDLYKVVPSRNRFGETLFLQAVQIGDTYKALYKEPRTLEINNPEIEYWVTEILVNDGVELAEPEEDTEVVFDPEDVEEDDDDFEYPF